MQEESQKSDIEEDGLSFSVAINKWNENQKCTSLLTSQILFLKYKNNKQNETLWWID